MNATAALVPKPRVHRPSASGSVLQRCSCGSKSESGEECTECAKRRLQRSPTAARTSPIGVPAVVHDVLRQPGEGLRPPLQADMGARFGRDFSRVRIHTDRAASESADAVGALAYTVGPHIVFGAGRFAPDTGEGRGLLAHELVHTLQQEGGPGTLNRLAIDPEDSPAEREAEARAASVLAGGLMGQVSSQSGSPIVRRATITKQSEWRRVGDRERQVTLAVQPGKCVTKGTASFDKGLDQSHAFFVIDLCSGHTAGQISGDLNYEGVLGHVASALASELSHTLSGQGHLGLTNAVNAALGKIGATGTIHFGLQRGDFQIALEGTATASMGGGVTGAGGKLRAAHSVGQDLLGGEISVGHAKGSGLEVGVNLTYTPGGKPRQPDCDVCECTKPKTIYTCSERPLPSLPAPPTEPLSIPLFYKYATTDPRGQYARCLQKAAELIQAGWTIKGVEGRTSPEGPLKRLRPEGFENRELAQKRADRASKDLRGLLSQRLALAMRGRESIARALAGRYEVIGRAPGRGGETAEMFGSNGAGEVPDKKLLPHLRDTLPTPKAGKADPLVTEHVIGPGLPGCMGSEPAADVTAFRDKIDDGTLTGRDLEMIYRPMRRALIVLQPPLPTPDELAPALAVTETKVPCTPEEIKLLPVLPDLLFESKCRPDGKRKS